MVALQNGIISLFSSSKTNFFEVVQDVFLYFVEAVIVKQLFSITLIIDPYFACVDLLN